MRGEELDFKLIAKSSVTMNMSQRISSSLVNCPHSGTAAPTLRWTAGFSCCGNYHQ